MIMARGISVVKSAKKSVMGYFEWRARSEDESERVTVRRASLCVA